jgi:hypothetical protein
MDRKLYFFESKDFIPIVGLLKYRKRNLKLMDNIDVTDEQKEFEKSESLMRYDMLMLYNVVTVATIGVGLASLLFKN